MSRSETFQTLLDKAESPVQTHILLAQLTLLRRQDRERNDLDRRGFAAPIALVILAAFALVGIAPLLVK